MSPTHPIPPVIPGMDPGAGAVLRVLRHFDLPKNPWIHSFLSPTSPVTYLEQLNYSLQTPQGVLATLNVSTSSSLGEKDHVFAVNETIEFLMLSSFSTGHITLGFEITRRKKTAVQPAILTPYVARAVRDDATGILFSIADHHQYSVSEITSCTQLSPGHIEHVYVICNTDLLHQSLHATDPAQQQRLFKNCVMYSFYSIDVRRCPLCSNKSNMPCSCNLLLSPKKHPADYEADRDNIESFTGDYNGVSTVAIYEDGAEHFRGNYVTAADSTMVHDNDLQQYLGSWAMRHALSSTSVNVLNFRMPIAISDLLRARKKKRSYEKAITYPSSTCTYQPPPQPQPQTISESHSNVSDEVYRLITDLQHAARKKRSDTGLSDGESTYVSADAGEQREDPLDNFLDIDGLTADILAKRSTQTSSSSLQFTASSSPPQTQAPTSPLQVVSQAPVPAIPATAEDSLVVAPSTIATCTAAPSSVVVPSTAPPSTSLHPVAVPHPIIHIQQSIPLVPLEPQALPKTRIGRPPIQRRTAPIPVVPLAPALPGLAPLRPPSNAFSEELKRKDEIRKARNRASARRSNLKKKQSAAKLKEDLRLAKEHEEALRMNERSLREENLALRTALVGDHRKKRDPSENDT